jgi:hypothetical protein
VTAGGFLALCALLIVRPEITERASQVTFSKKEIEREAADLEGQLTALRAS